MKLIILLLCFVFSITMLHAQKANTTAGVSKIPSAIYFESGGAGVLFSLNYDRRLIKGLGMRVGIGHSLFSGNPITTVPIGVYYVLGKRKSLLELGFAECYTTAGGSPVQADYDNAKFDLRPFIPPFMLLDMRPGTHQWVTAPDIAYRWQPYKSFTFRVGLQAYFAGGGDADSGNIFAAIGYSF